MQLLGEEFPSWAISTCGRYYSDAAARLGATPDAFATRPDIPGLGIIQIKTAGHFAFKKGWRGVDGDIEVPLWIAIQASVEAALTGASWAAIFVMTIGDGGLEPYLEEVPLRPALMTEVRRLAADFWRRVAEKDPYPPDYRQDAALLARIYRDDDGSEIDLSRSSRATDIVSTRDALKEAEAAGATAEKERKAIDAELIRMLGNATRGRLADGRFVEAKTIHRKGYTKDVKPSSYRPVNIKGNAT
jgi:hypothetical protein